MKKGTSTAPRSRLFLGLAWVGAAAALVGFAKTFFLPLLTGAFRAHPAIYAHAALLFGWVAFFLAQALHIHRQRVERHRRLGGAGAALAAGVVVSTIAVATLAARRTAAAGDLAAAQGELLVVQIEMAVFAALVAAALHFRRRPEFHKRLMLLAFIGSLGPAWFRFRHYFPEVGNPLFLYSVLLADSLILVAMLADALRYGRPHRIYVQVGGAMVALHLVEVFAFASSPFRAVAAAVAGPML
ncbi:hypothetical protein [Sphingopyxis flava]|uniref:Uncharacterized protein n=1 Tax=Sphingopyxis flava TaxID=1507287 RepID=A0A1T4ZS21_9SPHN|nr:hypothetical protein [Sphingopyxis flava]SKB25387.1 hypothetical protein SAMN06295937_100168 [Sphingopyxis flava]